MFGRTGVLFRRRSHAPVMYGGITLFGREYFATEDTPGMTETRRRILEKVVDPEESGWDRLQVMYGFDQYGELSPELSIVSSGFFMGLAGGGIVGAAHYAKEAMQKFVRRNVETQYLNHLEAKRALQDSVTLAMMKGGFKWGFKLGLWTGGFLLVGMTISTFRNKSGILEYIMGGVVIGTLFKFSMGPKGMLAGAVVGALGGLFVGMVNMLLALASGTTMAERRYWLHHRREGSNTEEKWRREHMRAKDKVYDSNQILHESRLHEEELARKGLLERFRKEVAEEVEAERVANDEPSQIARVLINFVPEKLLKKDFPVDGEGQKLADEREAAEMKEAVLKTVEERLRKQKEESKAS